jgi:hypothetical protein
MNIYSLVFSFSVAILFIIIEKLFSITINPKLLLIPILGIFPCMASSFIRISEYENLNGYFEGQLILDDEYISVNDNIIVLKDIVDLEMYYFDFSGRKTNNNRYGPMYANGIGNQIIIKTLTETIECYFEIGSEAIIYKIEQYLYDIVINKKIPVTKNNLDLVPIDFRDSKSYQALLEN